MSLRSLKLRVYRQLEPTAWPRKGLSPTNLLLAILIIVAVISAVIETEPTVAAGYEDLFGDLELLFAIIFLVAYVGRIWTVVDSSSAQIVGAHLFERSRSPLRRLAKSQLIWERRIAIIATAYFIKRDELDDTLAISELLLDDREDLIHKAVGWMLREVGNRDVATLEAFLRAHYRNMPRTALRYAIEKFSPEKRRTYLDGTVE